MNRVYYKYIGALSFSSVLFIIIVNYLLSEKCKDLNIIILLYVASIILIGVLFLLSIRKILLKEWEKKCDFLDKVIMNRGEGEFDLSKETLFSKEQRKIKELVRVLNHERFMYEKDKESIQSLVTDLSHQIKTPLANISMYNATLLDREIPREKQVEFLSYTNTQIIKLQWLMDALIKISRLETDIISLNKDYYRVEDTLAIAIGGVYGKAMSKNINIKVDCNPSFTCYHDMKWTAEAIFNILENSVKYTNEGGEILVSVNKWESFTRIEVKDTGIGIDENEINNIFKRFYRGKNVSQKEGAGIGLYLAREIILKQGGYIKVKSKLNVGTTFSIFLLNLK